MSKNKRAFTSPNGVHWVVEVTLGGSSNAMVLFRHPQGTTARLDRYNWYLSNGPEARSVTSHLSEQKILDGLTESDLEKLYRRSMNISRPDPLLRTQDASNG